MLFKKVSERVLSNHVGELRKNLYVQDGPLLERHCRPIMAITSRCLAIVEMQEWGKTLGDKLFLPEIKLGMGNSIENI